MFNYLYLGQIDYAIALDLQRALVELRHDERIANTLLLLEHPPVITLGRNAHRSNILASDEELTRRSITVHEINRGGDVTYHGPGQLVGYPIFDLRSFSPRLGIVDFVRMIEEALIRFCAASGVVTQRVPGRTGVWTVTGGNIQEKKIAAIGVHVSRGITSHGFALNITTDLRDFELIVPCGIEDRSVTSLELEVADPLTIPPLESVAHQVSRHVGLVFGQQVLALSSLNDLLTTESPLETVIPASKTIPVDTGNGDTGIIPADTPLRIPPELKRLKGEEEQYLA